MGEQPTEPTPVHLQAMRLGRRILIAIVGGVVVLAGVVLAMPLVPGPGLVVVAVGLAILSLEFEQPRIWLARMKRKALEIRRRLRIWRGRARRRYNAFRQR